MIRLDAATVALQWATGGLFFLWVTTRGRLVGLGYGWLLRAVYAAIAGGGLIVAWLEAGSRAVPVRDAAAAALVVAAFVAIAVSVVRRTAGVSGQRELANRRKERVAAMAGARAAHTDDEPASAAMVMRDEFGRVAAEDEKTFGDGPEFPPMLDLVAPAIGVVGLVAAALDAGGNPALAIARTLVGAAFLGVVSDAMLLGHWYLVQPGLPRAPIHELNNWLIRLLPVEIALLLIPTGMISVLSGDVSDGWGGLLGWTWVVCALTTAGLAITTRIALKERFYSAVMAATGFLYLAILTAFGTDLIARAILSG